MHDDSHECHQYSEAFPGSFADKAKARFKKWAPDANDVYMSVAKHVANSEKYVGKNFILGLIKDEEWVNVDKDHKVRHDIYLHRPINEIGDLGDVINEAGSKNTEYRFMYVVDGKITIIDNAVDATKAAEELGMTYIPKRLAKEETTNE